MTQVWKARVSQIIYQVLILLVFWLKCVDKKHSKVCLVLPTHPGLGGGLVAFPRTLKAQYELGSAQVAH